MPIIGSRPLVAQPPTSVQACKYTYVIHDVEYMYMGIQFMHNVCWCRRQKCLRTASRSWNCWCPRTVRQRHLVCLHSFTTPRYCFVSQWRYTFVVTFFSVASDVSFICYLFFCVWSTSRCRSVASTCEDSGTGRTRVTALSAFTLHTVSARADEYTC